MEITWFYSAITTWERMKELENQVLFLDSSEKYDNRIHI